MARETLLEQEIAQQALVDATRRSLELSQQRYELGADDYLAVLDAQRSLLTARQELVSITLSKLANQITLYRALGGGWLEDQATVINTAPEQEDSDTSGTQG